MPTSLVTKKMHPALAERIGRSVEHGSTLALANSKGGSSGSLGPTVRLLLRFAIVSALAIVVVLGMGLYRAHVAELAEKKNFLVSRVVESRIGVRPGFAARLARAETAIAELAKASDFSTPTREGLAKWLGEPVLYARVEIADATDSKRRLLALTETRRDALLGCLLEAPESGETESVLARVRSIYKGETTRSEEGGSGYLLQDLVLFDAYAGSDFSKRIEKARSVDELRTLGGIFATARPAQHRKAASATRLLSVLDEPKRPGTPLEFDGATTHDIRLALTDLESGTTLVRFRLALEPTRVPEKYRQRYARGLSECSAARLASP